MTPRAEPVRGLRERRAAETRAEIVEAAIRLFIEQGFDATSMSDVAAAAGVSRRTVYRYFATKDDIVFEAPRRWLEVFDAVLEDRGPHEPTRDVFRRGLVSVAEFIRDDAEAVLAAFSVLAGSESLVGRHGRSDAEWVQRYLEVLGPDVASLEDGPLLATTAAMALVAAQNAIIATWAFQPDRDPVEMMEIVLDQVDSLWPQPSREPPS